MADDNTNISPAFLSEAEDVQDQVLSQGAPQPSFTEQPDGAMVQPAFQEEAPSGPRVDGDYAEAIPNQAIDWLMEDPSNTANVDVFNERFGAGRAQEVISERLGLPSENVSLTGPSEEVGYLGHVGRGAVALGYGAQEFVNETANFFYEPFENAFGIEGDNWRSNISVFSRPEDWQGQFSAGIVQYGLGFFGSGKLTGLTGLYGGLVNGAIADYVVFNPDDPNITGFLSELGYVPEVVTELLATDPADPDYINRLRNASEGAVIGGVVEAIGWGIRRAYYAESGRPQDAVEAAARQADALQGLRRAIEEETAVMSRRMTEAMEIADQLPVQIADDIGFDLTPSSQRTTETPRAPGMDPGPRAPNDADPEAAPRAPGDPEAAPAPDPELGAVQSARRDPPRGEPIGITPDELRAIRMDARRLEGETPMINARGTAMRSPLTFNQFEDYLAYMNARRRAYSQEYARMGANNPKTVQAIKVEAAARLNEYSELVGTDVRQLLTEMQGVKDNNISNLSADIMAQADMVLSINQELTNNARMINDIYSGRVKSPKEFGVANVRELEDRQSALMTIAANAEAIWSGNTSEVGRALRMMQEAKKGNEAMRLALRDAAGVSPQTAARIIEEGARNGRSAVDSLRRERGTIRKVADFVNGVRINFLLSGPGTQEVNLVSSLVQSIALPANQFVGGMGQVARGNVRQGTRNMEHALRQFAGSTAGFVDFFFTMNSLNDSASLRAFMKKEGILDPSNQKIDEGGFSLDNSGVFGEVVTLPSRLLLATDELFKQSQYRGRIYADATFEARDLGLRGQQAEDHIKQYIRDSYDDQGRATRQDALLQAQRATFTEPLDPGWGMKIQQFAAEYPLARFILPFVRTPINLLSESFQYMPGLNLISRRFKDNMAAGGVRAAQAQGRLIMGIGAVAMIGHAASNGNVTGSGPSDPRIRQMWLRNNQPYAFRQVNEDGTVTWHSYQRFEPFSNVMSIVADISYAMMDPYNELEERSLLRAAIVSIADNTFNKTFTQGIHNFMLMLVGRPEEQDKSLNNAIGSFIPNFLNQTNGDQAYREIRNPLDVILSRTWLYNDVDPSRDPLGAVVDRTLPKYEPLGLFHEDRREVDVVFQEFMDLGLQTEAGFGMPSRTLAGPNQIDLAEQMMTNSEGHQQSMYDRWLELSGTTEIEGMTLRERLTDMITNPNSEYNRNLIVGAPGVVVRGTRAHALRQVITMYREKAKMEVEGLPELMEAEQRGMGILLQNESRNIRPSQNSQFLFDPGLPGLDRPLDAERDTRRRNLFDPPPISEQIPVQ